MKKAETNKTPFVFYPTFYDQLQAIKNDKVRLVIYDALARYGICGIEPDFTDIDPLGTIEAIFVPMRQEIDKAKARYIANVNNGKKGGNPNFKKGKPNPYYTAEDNPEITEDNPEITEDNPEITEDNPTLPPHNLNIDKDIDIDKDKDIDNIPPISKEIFPPTEQGAAFQFKKRLGVIRHYTQERGQSVSNAPHLPRLGTISPSRDTASMRRRL